MVRLAAAIIMAALLCGGAEAAHRTAAREFDRLDLYGAWAPNCAEAASPDNPHVMVAPGGKGHVIEQDEFGSGYEINRYLMIAARRIRGRHLAVDALFQQGENEPEQQLIVMDVGKRTRRTVFTGTGNDPPLVKDGIVVAMGKPTPKLNKCD